MPYNLLKRMRKILFILIVAIVTNCSIKAQTKTADTGKVEIVQADKIKELLEKHKEINEKAKIKGYRVKIHFGTDKSKAKEIKADFMAKYPDVTAYEKYDQPNFNIRVGDFRTKLEAYKFLKKVQIDFPASFLVQDDIEFPKTE